jgi:hypothetical protein
MSNLKKVLDPLVVEILEEKFKLLSTIDSFDYCNHCDLDDELVKYKNHTFLDKEKILILHHDTGFYQDLNSGTSVFLQNLFLLLEKYSIPSEFLIFITNHYGITKELELMHLKSGYCINNVIETALWYDFPPTNFIDDILDQSMNFEYDYLYTCLNNVQRIHRNYTLCQLKENDLLSDGILSYRFKK